MSQPAANCPNCGAPVRFRWSGGVQTTCEYCHSILVRRDLSLEKVGEVSELPLEGSPIQIGTEGTYNNKAFQVVGRIVYEYEQGDWNEWHIVFNDGTSGWLSDAQLEYDVSFQTPPPEVLPRADEIARGRQFLWSGARYEVTSVTRAHYRGVSGELPFEYWNKKDVLFADLRTADARFGTIDYSEPAPLLFLGAAVEFDDLKLKNLRSLPSIDASEPGGAVAASALRCPGCGAPLTIAAAGQTISVVCANCKSVLDAKDPNLQVLEKYESKQLIQPAIPLGSRGKLDGDEYDVIGFQVRTTDVEGIPDSWAEYLLFNRYKGFRYLTEYNGHWNDVKTIPANPERIRVGKKPGTRLAGHTYVLYDTELATTTYVLGEFPWRAHVGEKNGVKDFIAVPRILSCEITEQETVWSLGEYVTGAQLWKAFQLPGQPPPARGIFANQPAPSAGHASSMWRVCLNLLSAAVLLAILFYVFAGQDTVFQRQYGFAPRSGAAEASFVTDTFEVKGHPSNVEVSIRTNLQNNWAYFNLALINETSGQGYDFGREVSYYTGRDSDGSWSEGGPSDSAIVPSVAPGKYYLRVEPEMAPNANSMVYTLEIKRGVPSAGLFWIAAALLVIPPVFSTWRAASFEGKRWAQSDFSERE
jgi:hypothetical protein